MNVEESIQQLEAILAENPRSLVFARLASLYLQQGRIDEAVALCEKGIQHNPGYVTGNLILGKAYIAKNDREKAEEQFRAVLSHDWYYVKAHKLLGDLMARTGWENKAATHYRDILSIDPLDIEIEQMLSTFSFEVDEPAARKPPSHQRGWISGTPPVFSTSEKISEKVLRYRDEEEGVGAEDREEAGNAPLETGTDALDEKRDALERELDSVFAEASAPSADENAESTERPPAEDREAEHGAKEDERLVSETPLPDDPLTLDLPEDLDLSEFEAPSAQPETESGNEPHTGEEPEAETAQEDGWPGLDKHDFQETENPQTGGISPMVEKHNQGGEHPEPAAGGQGGTEGSVTGKPQRGADGDTGPPPGDGEGEDIESPDLLQNPADAPEQPPAQETPAEPAAGIPQEAEDDDTGPPPGDGEGEDIESPDLLQNPDDAPAGAFTAGSGDAGGETEALPEDSGDEALSQEPEIPEQVRSEAINAGVLQVEDTENTDSEKESGREEDIESPDLLQEGTDVSAGGKETGADDEDFTNLGEFIESRSGDTAEDETDTGTIPPESQDLLRQITEHGEEENKASGPLFQDEVEAEPYEGPQAVPPAEGKEKTAPEPQAEEPRPGAGETAGTPAAGSGKNESAEKEGKKGKSGKIVSPTLGEIYAAQGQFKKAVQVYETLIDNNPESEDKYRRKIEELEKKIEESGE